MDKLYFPKQNNYKKDVPKLYVIKYSYRIYFIIRENLNDEKSLFKRLVIYMEDDIKSGHLYFHGKEEFASMWSCKSVV